MRTVAPVLNKQPPLIARWSATGYPARSLVTRNLARQVAWEGPVAPVFDAGPDGAQPYDKWHKTTEDAGPGFQPVSVYRLSAVSEPPPTIYSTMGVTVGPPAQDLFTRLESLVGALGARRIFSPGVPQISHLSWDVQVGRKVVYSFKVDPEVVIRGEFDLQYRLFVRDLAALLPDDQQEVVLVYWHEPEDNMSSLQHRVATYRLAQIVREERGTRNIKVGVIWMGWTFNPSSGRNYLDWWDSNLAATVDVIGIDEYQTRQASGAKRLGLRIKARFTGQADQRLLGYETWATRAARFTEKVQALGKPMFLGEYGCPENSADPDYKRRWLADVFEWATENGVTQLLYFNYISGVISDGPDYLLDSSPQVIAEFARQVELALVP